MRAGEIVSWGGRIESTDVRESRCEELGLWQSQIWSLVDVFLLALEDPSSPLQVMGVSESDR